MHYRGRFRTSQLAFALTILCSCNPTCNGHENADVDFGGVDTCARRKYNANGWAHSVGKSIDAEESVKTADILRLCSYFNRNTRSICEEHAAFFGQPNSGRLWQGPAYDGIELVYACVWVYV